MTISTTKPVTTSYPRMQTVERLSNGSPANGLNAEETLDDLSNRPSFPPKANQIFCPHLGLDDDRTIMLIGPSQSHRCYAQPHPVSPDSERQAHFCLTTNHASCPLYREPQAIDNEFALVPVAPKPTTRYPLIPTQPKRAGQSNRSSQRVLLPMRPRVKPRQSQRRGPYLLPAVSSYSARRLHRWSFFSTKITIVLVAFLVLATLTTGLFARSQGVLSGDGARQAPSIIPLFGDGTATETKTPLQAAVVVGTPTPEEEPDAIATPVAENREAAVVPAVILERFITPTPEPGGMIYWLSPGDNDAGWWMENDVRRNRVNDSFLYTGISEGNRHIAAIRFDLRRVPRGAALVYGELRLTGLRAQALDPSVDAQWQIQFIAEESLPNLAAANFLALLSAPAVHTLPSISTAQLAEGKANVWELDLQVRNWLEEQLLLGAQSFIVRIQAKTNNQETLFAWDSGLGPEAAGGAPILLLSGGPAPATPPVLPTKPFIVATLTPIPENVLTVVAQENTATAVAVTTGTYTPVPYQVLTPTTFPENLATVQAAALDRNLPPVLFLTPTPASPAEATGQAQYATAVAITTGTFTPVPEDFVTPALIVPSPPPQNVATEAARSAHATSLAVNGAATPTSLPYNAVIAVYVYATSLPQNAATAVAQSVIATAEAQVEGTPTPLAWNAIVITKVPTPQSPTATPLPSLQPISDFTPTPTPTFFARPETMPVIYRNKIVFKTNRSGREETFALDPNSGELFRVNEPWVHEMAYETLALSPDGTKRAIVKADPNRTLQIQIRDLNYSGEQQITTLKNISYDPAWSPLGDKIAFVSKDSGHDEIYVVTADGSTLQKLTSRHNSWDKHPSFSPDGSQIVFFSNRDSGRRQLWIMNADGSNQRNLSNNTFEEWYPIWIP